MADVSTPQEICRATEEEYQRLRKIEEAIVRECEEAIREAQKAVAIPIREQYAEAIKVANTARATADAAQDAARIAFGQHKLLQMGDLTRVEWDRKGRGFRYGPMGKTGRSGAFIVYTRDCGVRDVFYSLNPGDIIFRINKKDGTPSAIFIAGTPHRWYPVDWAPARETSDA